MAEPDTGRPVRLAAALGSHLQRQLQHAADTDLNQRNIINANSYRLMENRTCQTKIHLFHEITSLIDKNNIGGVIYLDFCKAIDLVLYDILIKKLKQYTINMAHIK